VIYLDNPLLPKKAPLAQAELWLFPWQQDSNGRWVTNFAAAGDAQ
jgi:hypothetical protein